MPNITQTSLPQKKSKGKIKLSKRKIKQLRVLNGYSQDSLATALYEKNYQVSIATLKRAETGKEVSFRVASELANFFDTTIEALLPSKKNPPIEAQIQPSKIHLFAILITNNGQCDHLSEDNSHYIAHHVAELKDNSLEVVDIIGNYIVGFGYCYPEPTLTPLVLKKIYNRYKGAHHCYDLKIALTSSKVDKYLAESVSINNFDLNQLITILQSTEHCGLHICDPEIIAYTNFHCLTLPNVTSVIPYWCFSHHRTSVIDTFGRDQELLQFLKQQSDYFKAPRGPLIVQVSGASGIGKSHLCELFLSSLESVENDQIVRLSPLPFPYQKRPMIVELLILALDIKAHFDLQSITDKISETLPSLPPNQIDKLLALIHQPWKQNEQPPSLPITTDTIKLISTVIRASNLRGLFIDDITLFDQQSVQLLQQCLADEIDNFVLIFNTSADEALFKDTVLEDHPKYSLTPLTHYDCRLLAEYWTQQNASKHFVDQCADIAKGYPKFLKQMLLNKEPAVELNAVSLAFVDQQLQALTTQQRSILNTAVILGIGFSNVLIETVFPMAEQDIAALCQCALLDKIDHQEFKFTHSGIYQHIKDNISKPDWIASNKLIISALSQSPTKHADGLITLAICYQNLGDTSQAAQHYIQAAKLLKSNGQFDQAADLIHQIEHALPGNLELNQAIEILLLQGSICRSQFGWSSPQQKIINERLAILLSGDSQHSSLNSVIFNRWLEKLMALDLVDAKDTALSLHEISHRTNDDCARVNSLIALANTYYWIGQFEQSIEAANSALQLHQAEHLERDLAEFGQDPRVVAYLFLTLSHSRKGQLSEAESAINELYQLNRHTSNILTEAIAFQAQLFYYLHLNQIEQVERSANCLLQLANRHNLPFFIGVAKLFLGWSYGHSGKVDKGLSYIRDAYNNWLAKSGHLICHSLYCLFSAQLLYLAEQFHPALLIAQKGQTFMHKKGELCYLTEIDTLIEKITSNVRPM